MRKFIAYSLLTLCSLITADVSAVNFRDGSLSYLYGDKFKVEPAEQQTVTFEYVAAWDWVDFFMFVDFKDYQGDGSGRYGEFSPRLKLYQFDNESLIKKILFSTTFERGKNGVESNLYGIAFDFNISGFRYLNVNLLQRDDPDLPGKGYQMTTVWAFDTSVGELPILIDGYYDWTFNSDEQQDNFHFNPQVKLDMKSWLGGNQQWYLGIEYDYWKNKYGIKDTPLFRTNQNTLSFLAQWHF